MGYTTSSNAHSLPVSSCERRREENGRGGRRIGTSRDYRKAYIFEQLSST